MSPEFVDFDHCGDVFPPHPDRHPEWVGTEDIQDAGFVEAA